MEQISSAEMSESFIVPYVIKLIICCNGVSKEFDFVLVLVSIQMMAKKDI